VSSVAVMTEIFAASSRFLDPQSHPKLPGGNQAIIRFAAARSFPLSNAACTGSITITGRKSVAAAGLGDTALRNNKPWLRPRRMRA